jgi:hypothetical protein
MFFYWISVHTLLRGVTLEQIRLFSLIMWVVYMSNSWWEPGSSICFLRTWDDQTNEVSFCWLLVLIVVNRCLLQDKSSISFSMGSSYFWCRRIFCYDGCFICCSCRGWFMFVLVKYISMSSLLLCRILSSTWIELACAGTLSSASSGYLGLCLNGCWFACLLADCW